MALLPEFYLLFPDPFVILFTIVLLLTGTAGLGNAKAVQISFLIDHSTQWVATLVAQSPLEKPEPEQDIA